MASAPVITEYAELYDVLALADDEILVREGGVMVAKHLSDITGSATFDGLADVPAGDGLWARESGALVWKPESDFLTTSTVTTKGDILAATGSAALARLAAGADGSVLIADSAQAAGLRWGVGPEGLSPTAVKSSAYAAAPFDFVPVDTTSAGVTVTLPNAPTDGTRVAVKMVLQGGTHAVTINCAGSDVFNKAGGSTGLTLQLLNQAVTLLYKASLGVWYVQSDDAPLAQLDARYLYSLYYVKNYGAKFDGTTDDYTAITAALQAAKAAGGGIVQMPAGTCKTAGKLQIPEGVWLRGVGMVITGSTPFGTRIMPHASFNSDAVVQPEHIDASQESMALSDFALDFGLSAPATITDCGIDVRGVFNDSFLRNIHVRNGATYSVPSIRYAPATAVDGLGAVLSENVHVTPYGDAVGILVTDRVTGTEVNGPNSLTFVCCSVEAISGSSPAWHFVSSYAAGRNYHHTLVGCRGRTNHNGLGSGYPVLIEGCSSIGLVSFHANSDLQTTAVKITNDANGNAAVLHWVMGLRSGGAITTGIDSSGFTAASADIGFFFHASGHGDSYTGAVTFPRSSAGTALKVQTTKDSVFANAQLANNAQVGFVYLPTMAGAPSAVPGGAIGCIPVVIDATNGLLYAYINGAWKSTRLGAARLKYSAQPGAVTSFTVAHGLGYTPTILTATANGANAMSAPDFYLTADGTNITFNFAHALLTATTYNWSVMAE